MMLYTEYQPNILLSPYIETYWAINGIEEKGRHHKILPDGCVDIIFSFGDTPYQGGLAPMLPNIIGTVTTYTYGFYSNWVNMLGIRFRPVGITAFTRVSINEFTDHRVNLTLVETLFDKQFYAELPEKESIEAKIQHIESYLIRKLKNTFKLELQIVSAVNLIQQTKGQLPLTEVANKSCLSLRHFERKFKTAIGISPKAFSKIIKFNHTLSYLKHNSELSLFSAAIDCGYYDQAHLIKDFRTLSGNLPSDFRKS